MNMISDQGRMLLQDMVNTTFNSELTSVVNQNCSVQLVLRESAETFLGKSYLLQVSFKQKVEVFEHSWEMTFLLIYRRWKFPVCWLDFVAVPVSYAPKGQRLEICIRVGTKRILAYDFDLIEEYSLIGETLLENLKELNLIKGGNPLT